MSDNMGENSVGEQCCIKDDNKYTVVSTKMVQFQLKLMEKEINNGRSVSHKEMEAMIEKFRSKSKSLISISGKSRKKIRCEGCRIYKNFRTRARVREENLKQKISEYKKTMSRLRRRLRKSKRKKRKGRIETFRRRRKRMKSASNPKLDSVLKLEVDEEGVIT